MSYASFPYGITQQIFVWFWIGLPVSLGITGIWLDRISNQVASAFLIIAPDFFRRLFDHILLLLVSI